MQPLPDPDIAFERRMKTIRAWISPTPGGRILDVPCGRGFYLARYRHESPEATMIGCDLDGDALRRARASDVDVPLNLAAIEHLPFPSDVFDAAICSEVLEHVDDDAVALREVARTVRPGGLIAITVPHANYPMLWDPVNWVMERALGRHVSTGPLAGIWANHQRLYTADQLRAVVSSSGLQLEEFRSFTHHCMPFSHNLVYGIGKPLLDRNLLPGALGAAADRARFDQPPTPWNPVTFAIRVTGWFDRRNVDDEPVGRSTVCLAALARVPTN